MSIINEGCADSPLTKLEQALQQAAVGGKNKKDADFREAFPLIERYLANKVPQRLVLETFNSAYGYTLHPPRFRRMLLDERRRRAETGEAICCATCGQQLPSKEDMPEVAHDLEGR